MECQFCQHNLAIYSVRHMRDRIEMEACNGCTLALPDNWTVTAEHDISAWDFAG